MALRGDVDYKWVDRGCEECFAYICEILDEEAVGELTRNILKTVNHLK